MHGAVTLGGMTHLDEQPTAKRRRLTETNAQYTLRWLAISAGIIAVVMGVAGTGEWMVAGFAAMAGCGLAYLALDIRQRLRARS